MHHLKDDMNEEDVIGNEVILVTLMMLALFTLALLLCVCRKKPKVQHSFNGNVNVLPLNSIRTEDLLPQNLELVSFNNGQLTHSPQIANEINQNVHAKQSTLNRALPDIPSNNNTYAEIESQHNRSSDDGSQLNSPTKLSSPSQPLRKSNKPRAPQPPTHNRDTSPTNDGATTSTSDSSFAAIHHPYAKIKDSAVIDSSTENDTDDYCDPHYYKPTKLKQSTSACDSVDGPTVPAKRFSNSALDNPYLPFTSASFAVAGRVPSAEIPYMTPPPVHALNEEEEEENPNSSNKKSIQYNTISVREPLAKVLAERSSAEHHYFDVEDEQVSSFYEEIAGSTTSSVTYSKIGDITIEPSTSRTLPSEPPELPSIESLMIAAESTRSNSPSVSSSQLGAPSNNSPNDLYAYVDKRTKVLNRQTFHGSTSPHNVEEMYAKVQKFIPPPPPFDENPLISHSPKEPPSRSPAMNSNRPSTSNAHEEKGPPLPPLPPPPLNSLFPRSSRTLSAYITSNGSVQDHQRRHSSGNSSFVTTSVHFPSTLDETGYEIVRNTYSEVENDVGYEVIERRDRGDERMRRYNRISEAMNSSAMNCQDSPSEPGYETVRFEESDPTYETIAKGVSRNNSEAAEPGYEVIRRPRPYSIPVPNISRNFSDLSNEPGYERVRFIPRKNSENETDPPYACINKDDDEEEDTIMERL